MANKQNDNQENNIDGYIKMPKRSNKLDKAWDIGKRLLNETINLLNQKEEVSFLTSNIYTEIQIFYTENKDNKDISNITTYMMYLNFVIKYLYNLYKKYFSNFDRQSLKLQNILTDMYIIERDINKTRYYKDIQSSIEKDIVSENQIYTQIKEAIKLLLDVEQNDETILNHIEKLANIQRDIKHSIDVNTAKLEQSTLDIDVWRKDSKSITVMENDKTFLEFVNITFNSFITLYSINLMLEGICKTLNLDTYLILDIPYKLTSYTTTKTRMEELLILAFENKSVTENFEDSKLFDMLTDYINLETRMNHPLMEKIKKMNQTLIMKNLKLMCDLAGEQTIEESESDVNKILNSTINTIKKELRW